MNQFYTFTNPISVISITLFRCLSFADILRILQQIYIYNLLCCTFVSFDKIEWCLRLYNFKIGFFVWKVLRLVFIPIPNYPALTEKLKHEFQLNYFSVTRMILLIISCWPCQSSVHPRPFALPLPASFSLFYYRSLSVSLQCVGFCCVVQLHRIGLKSFYWYNRINVEIGFCKT